MTYIAKMRKFDYRLIQKYNYIVGKEIKKENYENKYSNRA